MASIELTNIPEELLRRLELAATARRHNLSEEIRDRLDESFGPPRLAPRRSPEDLRRLARQVRGEAQTVGITPEFIRLAREWGRE